MEYMENNSDVTKNYPPEYYASLQRAARDAGSLTQSVDANVFNALVDGTDSIADLLFLKVLCENGEKKTPSAKSTGCR